jgi:hypothetical protein
LSKPRSAGIHNVIERFAALIRRQTAQEMQDLSRALAQTLAKARWPATVTA